MGSVHGGLGCYCAPVGTTGSSEVGSGRDGAPVKAAEAWGPGTLSSGRFGAPGGSGCYGTPVDAVAASEVDSGRDGYPIEAAEAWEPKALR